jgi:hypothetical protein
MKPRKVRRATGHWESTSRPTVRPSGSRSQSGADTLSGLGVRLGVRLVESGPLPIAWLTIPSGADIRGGWVRLNVQLAIR